MNNVTTTKVMYRDEEYTVIPRSGVLTSREKKDMAAYVLSIGELGIVVDDELYVSEGGMFHLSMKYCEKYNFI